MSFTIEVNRKNVATKHVLAKAVSEAIGYSSAVTILVSRAEWDCIQRCKASTDDINIQEKHYTVSDIVERWTNNGAILLEHSATR